MAVLFFFFFYDDDITTASDICVMAVSRMQVESEMGDIVSDVLWRHTHIQKRKKEREGERDIVTEPDSMSERRDNILPLYGVIGRDTAAFLPAIPLNGLVLIIK